MDHQKEMLSDPSRFKICCWGRRCGKTIGALAGGIVWWVVPKIDDADHAFRHAQRAVADFPLATINKTKRRIEFANGGMLWIRTADDPQGLRGEGLDLVILDEYRNIKPEAWTDSLRPALSDKLGSAIFISTPNGRDHFWKLFKEAESTPMWNRWHLPTWANPTIPSEEIEAARRELHPTKFRQEYGAEFTVADGLYWEPSLFDGIFDWSRDVQVNEHGWPKCEYTIQVVDTSYGKRDSDFQAIINLGTRGDGHVYIEAGLGRDGLQAFAGKIVRMAMRLPVFPCWTRIEEFDYADGRAAVKDEVARVALDEYRTALYLDTIKPSEHQFEKRPPGGGLKEHRIMALDRYIRNGVFRFVDTVETRMLVDQFLEFRIGGKAHDDGPDAVARAMDSLQMLNAQLEEEGAWG